MHSFAYHHLSQYLVKAAGDRGGHVIGTTRSGKAIYASSHSSNAAMTLPKRSGRNESKQGDKKALSQVISAHGNYSAQDHADASSAHQKNSVSPGDTHDRLAHAHGMASGFVRARGKTSSQRPIFG